MFHDRQPDVPIIAMSGYAFANTERAPDFLRMTIEIGATRCLRKPFSEACWPAWMNVSASRATPLAWQNNGEDDPRGAAGKRLIIAAL